MSITKLHAVTPPTVPDQARALVIAELELALKEAREGDISEIILIIQHANPKVWSERSAFVGSLLTWVGRLEVTKQDLIAQLSKAEDEDK